MSSRANKISTATPRRTSERKAKAKALSTLSNKTNIIPTSTPKCPSKKRLKGKRQRQSAASKVTPQRGLPVVVHPAQKFKPPTETLAHIDIEGVFLLNEMANPVSCNTPPTVKKIKVIAKSGKETSGPFPIKLFQMIEWSSVEYPDVCRWSANGRSIEMTPKNPIMLQILSQFFNHKKWLSFSRQLNNYGFVSLTPYETNFKRYKHPSFRRSIPDPKALVTLLPYLPGVRKRKERDAAAAPVVVPSKTKQSKGVRSSKSPKAAPISAKTVTPLASAKDFRNSGITMISASSNKASIKSSKESKKRSNTKSARGLQVTPQTSALPSRSPGAKGSSSEIKPISASSSEVSIQSTKKSNNRYPTRSARGLQVIPRANELPTKKRKKTRQVNNNEHQSDVGFLKTPSPQRRSRKAPFMSSPPPLSHYKHPKNHPAQDLTPNFVGSGVAAATGKLLSSNGSPLPSSLLTVNFDMTPSSLKKNDERTPRASNLSSSACSPSSSQDGFQMLSWAAQAVESPALHEATSEFMKSMCSPIVSAKKKQRSNQRFDIKRVGSTSTLGSSIMGPSPLSLRERQESLSELELLRNCLEDVFVATGAGGNAAVPQYYASV